MERFDMVASSLEPGEEGTAADRGGRVLTGGQHGRQSQAVSLSAVERKREGSVTIHTEPIFTRRTMFNNTLQSSQLIHSHNTKR